MDWFQLNSVLFLIFALGANADPPTVSYYKTYIGLKIAQTANYTLPQQNLQFEKGASSETIHQYPQKYDFIIVGAGTAGSVLATRLSEVPNAKILLIEAGNEENNFNRIPNMALYTQFSEMNWGYKSTPQKNCCLGMVDQRCMFPRGRVLGGSSSMSFKFYRRTNRYSFSRWNKLGWFYNQVLKYYKKSENSQIKGDFGYHGKGGWWNVEYPQSSPFQKIVLDAAGELNIELGDYNGRRSTGLSKPKLNIKHGQLQSTNTAFLDFARKRDNLDVITDALVIKIVLDEEKRAKGVIFVKMDGKYEVSASKEVILSAGPINTPQLLMLSGIGPEDHLSKLGIKVIKNLPVGTKMIDKVDFPGLIIRTNASISDASHLDTLIEEYLEGTGPLTKPLYVDLLANLPLEGTNPNIPSFLCLIIPPGRGQPNLLQKVFNYNDEINQKFLKQINISTDMVIHLILDRPKSTGSVTLKSPNPIDHPQIDVNYFDNPKDLDDFVEMIQFMTEKFIKTSAFQTVGAQVVHFDICGDQEKGSRGFWECAVKTLAQTSYQPSSTTPMGVDRSSVVDNKLRVHGIKRLRIVDAGIFSHYIGEEADVVMAAEKISDDIKESFRF